MTAPAVVALGTVALDTVESPAGRSEDAPGGSALYFAAAAHHHARVALLGAVGSDVPREVLERVAGWGVETAGLVRLDEPGLRWHARYTADGSRETVAVRRATLTRISVPDTAAYRRPHALFLGSTDPRAQAAALEGVVEPGLVVLDTMAHWIRERRGEVESLVARADVALLNGEEVRLLGGADDEAEAARAVAARGPRWVVVKRGARGAVAYGWEGWRAGDASPAAGVAAPPDALPWHPVVLEQPAVPAPVVDPTGAGDAFAGGFVGVLAAEGVRPAGSDAGTARRTPGATAVRGALAAGVEMGARAVSAFSFDGLVTDRADGPGPGAGGRPDGAGPAEGTDGTGPASGKAAR